MCPYASWLEIKNKKFDGNPTISAVTLLLFPLQVQHEW